MSRIFYFFAAFVILSLGGFGFAHGEENQVIEPEESPDVGMQVTNAFCVVLKDEPVDPDIWVDYEGMRVYFCCFDCRNDFIENPTAYIADISTFGGETPGTVLTSSEPDESEAHSHGHQEHGDNAEGEEEAAEGHDHTRDHDIAGKKPQGIGRLVKFTGNFHPLVVHFPIALILIAALAELLFMYSGNHLFSSATRFMVFIGGLSAVAAALLGWATAAYANYPGLDDVLQMHRWLGTSSGVFILATAIVSELMIRKGETANRGLFRIMLFVSAVLVGVTGHFGGTLVFGTGHYTW